MIMFSLFAAVILIFSVLSVFTRRILRAAVYLLFVLIATSGLYFMLDYQFLAGVQLTVYAGGIVVLIIFSILLTTHISHKFEKPHWSMLVSGIGVVIIGMAVTVWSILSFHFKASVNPPLNVDMHVIGRQLVEKGDNGYALPFEVISLLLLAAMIGAIVIAKKEDKQEEQ
jgi:NADH-quinone oxidoreductase subunit J